MEVETETGGSSGTDSGSGLAVKEAGNPNESPEKSDSATGKKPGENEEIITTATAQRILKKLDEASKKRNTISSFVEKKIQELKADIKKVEEKTEIVSAMQDDIKSVKEGLVDITKRVSDLEKSEGNLVEEMKKHFTKVQEEETKKNNLKEKTLAEIAKEEKCCLIIGFPFSSTKKSEVIDGMIAAVMKEGTCSEELKASVEISWMKAPEGEKKGLICLSLNSKIKRDHFLANINNSTPYRLRKTVSQRYRDPQKKLDQVAYVLR